MKLKRHIQFFATLTMVSVLFSCTEKIDLPLDENYARLAVESYITINPDTGYVRLTQTAGYFSNEAPPVVSGATVTIQIDNDLYLLDEEPPASGYYHLPPDFDVNTNDNLYLSIDLKEPIADESHFEAQTYMPYLSDQIDSINVEYNGDFGVWIVKLYAIDPPGPNFYMFNVMRNDTILTDSVSRVSVSDDRLVDDMYINGIWVIFLEEEQLAPGDKVTLITSSITADYYDFIIELQTEIGYKDPLFSGPPANVSTNLSNNAVGFFSAFPSAYTDYVIPADALEK